VHRGFYYAYLDIASQVIGAVKDYRTKFNITSVTYLR
jgi:hypothetical protein